MPVDQIEERLGELPSDVDIVTYCRGPYCIYAHEAVKLLRPTGRKARRLEGGFLEWLRHGQPTTTI